MSRLIISSLLASLALASTARAEQLFVRVAGQTQGVIGHWYNPVATLGGVALGEYGAVADLSWSVVAPRDTASGLPTGKRTHKPLVLRLRLSGAVSALGNALTDNENLSEVRVQRFVDDPETGDPTLATTFVLTGGTLSTLNVYTVREASGLVTYADVAILYQAIGIEDVGSGTSYEDSVTSTR